MRSWYRDVYRGYWGFEGVQRVFDGYPTYMIWDDHEIGDGWGSHYFREGNAQDGLRRMLPDLDERGLTYDEGLELMQRMFRAAQQTYVEYQHSHDPPTPDRALDYAFRRGGCAFYVLDGRGQRDIERESYRILGREQFDRFADWAGGLTPEETPFEPGTQAPKKRRPLACFRLRSSSLPDDQTTTERAPNNERARRHRRSTCYMTGGVCGSPRSWEFCS